MTALQEKNYVIYTVTAPGDITPIYVGLTQNFKKRATQHRTPSTWKRNPNHPLYQAMTVDNRYDFVFSIHTQTDTLEEGQKLEEKAIRELKPLSNSQKGTYRNIKAMNFLTKEYKEFRGVRDAGIYTEQNPGNINLIIKGHVSCVNGWVFTDELEPNWSELLQKAEQAKSSKPRPVIGTEIATGIKKQFCSISAAARALGKDYGASDIGKVCAKQKKSAYKHYWEFA